MEEKNGASLLGKRPDMLNPPATRRESGQGGDGGGTGGGRGGGNAAGASSKFIARQESAGGGAVDKKFLQKGEHPGGGGGGGRGKGGPNKRGGKSGGGDYQGGGDYYKNGAGRGGHGGGRGKWDNEQQSRGKGGGPHPQNAAARGRGSSSNFPNSRTNGNFGGGRGGGGKLDSSPSPATSVSSLASSACKGPSSRPRPTREELIKAFSTRMCEDTPNPSPPTGVPPPPERPPHLNPDRFIPEQCKEKMDYIVALTNWHEKYGEQARRNGACPSDATNSTVDTVNGISQSLESLAIGVEDSESSQPPPLVPMADVSSPSLNLKLVSGQEEDATNAIPVPLESVDVISSHKSPTQNTAYQDLLDFCSPSVPNATEELSLGPTSAPINASATPSSTTAASCVELNLVLDESWPPDEEEFIPIVTTAPSTMPALVPNTITIAAAAKTEDQITPKTISARPALSLLASNESGASSSSSSMAPLASQNGLMEDDPAPPPARPSIMDRVNQYKEEQKQLLAQQVRQEQNATASRIFNRSIVSPEILEQRERLPIFAQREALIDCVLNNQFVIVIGETGSGKSTQIPQYLAEAGIQGDGKIGVTQPRRVAATDLAKRVAKECGVKLGSQVGYAVRFERKVSNDTIIKYMTDGLLVKECSNERSLDAYSVIIIDEAHERSIHTDVCFGLLKRAAERRPDLRVIISSATLETEKFSEYFDGAPVFKVEGQGYPVQIIYTPMSEDKYMAGAVDTIFNINRKGPAGDILVFLPGEEEIRQTWDLIHRQLREVPGSLDKQKQLIITCCYGALSLDEQKEIFKATPDHGRKVVLATNIAETSITIDGIVYVIDCGYYKQNKYNAKSGIYSLEPQRITRFHAIQRAGRAGRTRPGMCFRLYPENDFKHFMKEAPEPEITRSNVESVVLDIIAMGISDPLEFEFMDQPPMAALMEAMVHLQELSALDAYGRITEDGRRMSTFPLDPSLAKVVLESERLGCSAEVIKIVALLSTQYQNLFSRSLRDRDRSDGLKEKFDCSEGDMMTLLRIYDGWAQSGFSEDWCKGNNIQYRYLVEAKDIRKQLQDLLNFRGISNGNRGGAPLPPAASAGRGGGGGDLFEKIARAFTAGYFRQLAKKKPIKHDYQLLADVTNVQDVFLHPSSSLFKTKPQWVIYHEVKYTSKLFIRGVIGIDPAWITEYAPEFARKVVRFGVPPPSDIQA